MKLTSFHGRRRFKSARPAPVRANTPNRALAWALTLCLVLTLLPAAFPARAFTVDGDVTVTGETPVLTTSGYLRRDDDDWGEIQFECNIEGTVYYLALSGGSPAPSLSDITEGGTDGGPCAPGVNYWEVKLEAGDMDVYVVITAGCKASDILKFEIPAYGGCGCGDSNCVCAGGCVDDCGCGCDCDDGDGKPGGDGSCPGCGEEDPDLLCSQCGYCDDCLFPVTRCPDCGWCETCDYFPHCSACKYGKDCGHETGCPLSSGVCPGCGEDEPDLLCPECFWCADCDFFDHCDECGRCGDCGHLPGCGNIVCWYCGDGKDTTGDGLCDDCGVCFLYSLHDFSTEYCGNDDANCDFWMSNYHHHHEICGHCPYTVSGFCLDEDDNSYWRFHFDGVCFYCGHDDFSGAVACFDCEEVKADICPECRICADCDFDILRCADCKWCEYCLEDIFDKTITCAEPGCGKCEECCAGHTSGPAGPGTDADPGPSTPTPSPDTIPGGGAGGDDKVDIPITVDKGEVAVELDAETTETLIENALAQAEAQGGGAAPTVTLDLSEVKDATAAVLQADAAQAFSEADVAVTVKLPGAEITLPPETLAALAEAGGDGGAAITIEAAVIPQSEIKGMQAAQVKGCETVVSIDVFVGDKKVDVPVTVSMPYKLKPGEDPKGVQVWYMDDNGNLTNLHGVYDETTGMITFPINHQSYFVVGYDPVALWVNVFGDLDPASLYYEAIAFMNQQGLMAGYGNGNVGPADTLTRAQFATLLWNLEGQPDVQLTVNNEPLTAFEDVLSGAWYYAPVTWAAEKGVVAGIGGGLFDPGAPISRQQVAQMLYNYAVNYKGYEIPENRDRPDYADQSQIDAWAETAAQKLAEAGVLNAEQTFRPRDDATRGEAADMFRNFVKFVAGE